MNKLYNNKKIKKLLIIRNNRKFKMIYLKFN